MKLRVCITGFFLLLPFSAQASTVQEVVSSNGVKAWLVEEHAVPLVAVKIMFTESGTATDTKGGEGTANLAASLFTEGAGDLDARAFSAAVESRAIALQAGVDEDDFNVSLETLSEHSDKAFELMGMALTKPRLDAESIERSKRQALSILAQQQESPGYRVWQAWLEKAFPGHPYSNSPVGSEESIAAISRDELEHYYNHYLTRENIIIAVVGDITAKQLRTLMDAHLSGLAAHFQPYQQVKDTTVALWNKPEVISFAVPQTMVAFGLPGVSRHDKDFYNVYVLNQIIAGGGSLTSKLGKEMRIKKGLTYGVGSTMDLSTHVPTWRGTFATRNEQAGAALTILRSTLRDIAAHGVSQQELDDAKQYITGSFVLGLDSNGDIAHYLISMQLYGLGRDYLDRRNQLINAVTLDGVNAAAKRLIDVDKLRITIIGQPNMESKP